MLQKKCKKCLEAENIPLTDLLFYIQCKEVTIKKFGMYLQIKVKILILSQLIHYYL